MDRLLLLLILCPVLLMSLIIHEIAHGKMAFYRGDPTAFYQNRLSFNPLIHLDRTGTILLITTLTLSVLRLNPLVLGWAKPVPVKEENLDNSALDISLVAIAGPAVNLFIAFIAGLPFQLGLLALPSGSLMSQGIPSMFFYICVNVNILLAVFNLMPIPPLDGSRILAQFLPEKYQDFIKYPSRTTMIIAMVITLFLINWSGFTLLTDFIIKIFTNISGLLQ